MYKYTIKNIKIEHFIGILSREKEIKNSIIIDFTYFTDEEHIIDYSNIYNTIIDIVFSKKWEYIEDLIKFIESTIYVQFPYIKETYIRLAKEHPIGMDKCQEIFIEHEKKQ